MRQCPKQSTNNFCLFAKLERFAITDKACTILEQDLERFARQDSVRRIRHSVPKYSSFRTLTVLLLLLLLPAFLGLLLAGILLYFCAKKP